MSPLIILSYPLVILPKRVLRTDRHYGKVDGVLRNNVYINHGTVLKVEYEFGCDQEHQTGSGRQ